MNSVSRDALRQSHSQTGEYRTLIEWPTGRYAGGGADYSRKDGRNAA